MGNEFMHDEVDKVLVTVLLLCRCLAVHARTSPRRCMEEASDYLCSYLLVLGVW